MSWAPCPPEHAARCARRDGAVWLRHAIEAQHVRDAEAAVYEALAEVGWWHPAAGWSLHRTPAYDDPTYVRLQQLLLPHPALDRLRKAPRVLQLVQDLFGEPTATERGDLVRVACPGSSPTPPHQDHHYVRQAERLWTCWIPLHDTPLRKGPLQVWLGSAQDGPRSHSGPRPDAQEVADVSEARWASGHMLVGDILLVHSLTVHRALPNLTDTPRLSADFRYEPTAPEPRSKIRSTHPTQ